MMMAGSEPSSEVLGNHARGSLSHSSARLGAIITQVRDHLLALRASACMRVCARVVGNPSVRGCQSLCVCV